MRKACAAVAAIAFLISPAAPVFAQTLTGEMAATQYLVGTWDCSVTQMLPTGGSQQGNATLLFAAGPGNTLSQTFSSTVFSSVGLIGYSSQSRKYFSNSVDNMGGITTQTADQQQGARIIFSGTTTGMGRTFQSRDTDDKISDTKIHSLSEINIGGHWTKVAEGSCMKR